MADIIPREFIDLLLAKVDIVELINIQLPLKKKSGSNFFACCPFHNEKSASFSVSQTKQFYYCFGCGAHGNAIDFLIQHDRLSFPEAIETLAKHAGMEVPHTTIAHKKEEKKAAKGLHEMMEQVCSYYYEQMRHTERAITYLKNRHISGKIAQQFCLGYAPPGWTHLFDVMGKTNIDKQQLHDLGLTIKKPEGSYYDRFRERIMFPIHDVRGRVIGFGGRILDQGEPKYLNSPETTLFQKSHELYGLYHVIKLNRELPRIIIVEGYMDVIALFQHEITYAVATLGTATSEHHLKRLLRYTSEIIFCFDGDEAGRNAAIRALQIIFPLMQDNLQVRFLFLPEGEDPDSLVHKEGKEAFEQRYHSAPSLSDFFFQNLQQKSDMSSMEGRARFATLGLKNIKQLKNGIYQNMLLNELSKRSRIQLADLKEQIKPKNDDSQHFVAPNAKSRMISPLRLALTLLIQNPHLSSLINDNLPQNIDITGYTLFIQTLELIRKNTCINTGIVVEQWRGHKDEEIIAKLAHWQHTIPDSGIENEFLGAIKQLMVLGLEQEINSYLAKAAQTGLNNAEKIELSAKIAKKKKLMQAQPLYAL